MGVRRRQIFRGSQRVDVPHLRSIESALSNDFDELLKGWVTGEGNQYVIRGFEINMTGAIGSSASGLQVIVASSSVFNGPSKQSGTFYTVPSNALPEVLNSVTNSKVSGGFTPNAVNYVGLEYERIVDDATSDTVYFWNATSKNEFSSNVPLAQTMRYKFVITTSVWAANVVPIARVNVDVAGNVVSVTDQRPLMYRLGTAGRGNPDPSYVYPWNNQTEGRLENNPTSTSSTISPFRGGDKQIYSMKEWFDAIMSSLKEIKGTTYWYSENAGGSLVRLRQDLANTVVTGRGFISHDDTVAGKINWNQDIFLSVITSRLAYKIVANPSSSDVVLTENRVAYLNLVRDIPILPNLIFTNGSPIVSSVGSVSWTTNLQAGDFVKLATDDETKYYKILTVDSLSQVTLEINYLGTTTSQKAQYAFGVYETNPSPSTDRHVRIANREDVPFNDKAFWFLFRTDNGGTTPRVYVRFIGSELEQGEDREISDNTTLETLAYIGAPNEATSAPSYASNIRGVTGDNLTVRASVLTDAVGDEQEDRSAFFRSNDKVLWTGTQLQFTSDIVLEILNTKSGTIKTSTVLAAGSPLSLTNGQIAYLSINRSAATENLTFTIASSLPAQVQSSKDIIVFAKRIDVAGQGYLHLPFAKQVFEPGQFVRLGASGAGDGTIKAKLLDPVSTSLPTGVSALIDGVTVVNGDRVLFTNLSANNNRIYKVSGVGTSLVWTAEFAFNGAVTPTDGDAVRIQQGQAFSDQLAVFDGTNFKVNDVTRYFDGVSANFWEMTSIKTNNIVNNTTGNIFSVASAGSENFIVGYSINRGGIKETGQMYITHDGTNAFVNTDSAYSGSTGVNFDANLVGPNLVLTYTSDNAGPAGVLKYFVKRWSDAPGGPTGIPSYSGGGGGGGGAAGGANQEIQYNNAGALAGDPRFKWDAANNVLNMNGLKISPLSSTITLNDNQVSPLSIITFPAASNPFTVIEYSVSRGPNCRVGRLFVASNGALASVSDDGTDVGSVDIVFSAQVISGNVSIEYTSSSTGNTADFKYTTRQWS